MLILLILHIFFTQELEGIEGGYKEQSGQGMDQSEGWGRRDAGVEPGAVRGTEKARVRGGAVVEREGGSVVRRPSWYCFY